MTLHKMLAIKIVLILIAIAFAFIFFIDNAFINWQIFDDKILQTADISVYSQIKNHSTKIVESKLLFDHCDLPELDPWDPSILKYLKPSTNPLKYCSPVIKKYSYLKNGQLFINISEKPNSKCQWRCLLPKNDYNLKFGNWIEILNNGNSRPECDIVEVECQEKNKAYKFYNFMHAQIYRPDVSKKLVEPVPEKPDVHIIIFDSVSHSQFIRSMPKTRHILRETYEAVSFRHLNKVGLNSRPNGFATFMGKSVYSIAKSPMSRGYAADYNAKKTYCNHILDGDQFIGYRFQDDGYVTMISEDWCLGLFNYPNCKGFSAKPTDHYMRPFQLRLESLNSYYRSKTLNKIIHKDSCRETFHYQMDYLQNFIDTYPDKPKFSSTWMINLAHNDGNMLYHVDDYFYQFFKINKEKFKNSFVFVLGDHGLRFNGIRNTAVGELEDDNPFLFLSIPEKLRENSTLMGALRQNSKELVTHYDIYATLVDIVKPANPRTPNPIIKGSSFLNPLPQPRTCDRLRIPFEYCTCKIRKRKLSNKNPIVKAAAELMVSRMNENLRETNETKDCVVPLKLNSKILAVGEEFEEKGDVKVYQITYTTVPGNGNFWGYVIQKSGNTSLEILSEKFPRLNMYEKQARCAEGAKYQSYCFCKNLLSPPSTTKMPITTGSTMAKLIK